MVVDDSRVNLKIIDLILRRAGYETVLVADSGSVLKAVRDSDPCLILLDIDMPGLSGLEICRQLKESDDCSHIPVIFVTGNTDDATIKKAFALGGRDYVRKPVNEVELLARMLAVSVQLELTERLKYEEKMSGILELAGTICHEFNQPLQVILGSAELLLQKLPVGATGRTLAETIVNQTCKLGEINRKLMNITTYEHKLYIGNSRIVDLEKASTR